MNKNYLPNLICPECRSHDLSIETYVSNGDYIEEGRIICCSCKTWYRIEYGILDFLPISLRPKHKYSIFAKKHRLSDMNIRAPGEAQKLTQIQFFAECKDAYEQEVARSPYFTTLDKAVYEDWINKNIHSKGMILEIGCGTGRQTLPLVRRGHHVVGLDISEEMLIIARNKMAMEGFSDLVDLIVCDAENIPIGNIMFDSCLMVGTLHHTGNPHLVIEGAAKLIKKKGGVFTYDPHRSPFRFIFDWFMKIWKLYDEEASDNSLFTEQQIKKLFSDVDIKGETKISTFIPPHFFLFFTLNNNLRLLRLTDKIFGAIPFLRKIGGMVIFEGIKIN